MRRICGDYSPGDCGTYQAHLVVLSAQESVLRRAEEVYEKLLKVGVEVLFDDTDRPAGEKLADADLLGMPVRLVVSDKTGEKIEVKRRDDKKVELSDFATLGSVFSGCGEF